MKEKLTLVKVGGKIVEEDTLATFLADFATLPGRKLLVHGGGRSATRLAEQLGIPTQMVEGRRITDADTLRVVTMVYGGWVNKHIVATLQAMGEDALGLTGADMNLLTAVKRPVKDIDYGFVGDVTAVRTDALLPLLDAGRLPVVAPITHDGKGQLLNTNADTIAAELAIALAPHYTVTLLYCFEKPGVLTDENDNATLIPRITPASFRQYVANGIIRGGMLPKLTNAINAVNAGVAQVLITQATDLRSGTGTRILPDAL
jgi:acetylglutamate kinase